MEKVLGYLTPLIVYIVITVLALILPGRWVTGYVTKENSDEKLRYRLNGIVVLLSSILLWVALCYFALIPWNWFYLYRWESLTGAFVLGMVFSIVMVVPNPPVHASFFKDFYLGRLFNPQWKNGRLDAKMWLYLIGAILLQINILSFAAHHWMTFGTNASPGIFLSTALLTYFLFDYLTFEEVHLYTYDLFAERVGFKLGWGCIVFYPFFYSVAQWYAADKPNPETPSWLLLIYAVLFFIGWSLARGANMQKYYFKKDTNKPFLGIQPNYLESGNKKILINGWWGLSRHINYLGEILMASGIILCVGHPDSIWPWLYPLYYVALLFPRQYDDDKRCRDKYGALWLEYEKKVKWKIIPYIY